MKGERENTNVEMQLFIQFKAKPALTEFGAAVFLPFVFVFVFP